MTPMDEVTTKSLGEIADTALEAFRTFSDEDPDFVRTGLGPVDRELGGLFPGQGGVLGIAQGVGKTSTILTAAMESPDKTGIIFVEDTEDVIGARALAYTTGINSRDIRRKYLTDANKEALQAARGDLLREVGVRAVCHPGASMELIEALVGKLGQEGCRLIWLDYLQKVRGVSEQRNVEVASVYSRFQSACFGAGAAFMVASQFSRQVDPTARPQLHWLKESGDIENEARIAVLGWRDADDDATIHYRLAKSSMGGEGTTWSMRRDSSGTLREPTWFEEGEV